MAPGSASEPVSPAAAGKSAKVMLLVEVQWTWRIQKLLGAAVLSEIRISQTSSSSGVADVTAMPGPSTCHSLFAGVKPQTS